MAAPSCSSGGGVASGWVNEKERALWLGVGPALDAVSSCSTVGMPSTGSFLGESRVSDSVLFLIRSDLLESVAGVRDVRRVGGADGDAEFSWLKVLEEKFKSSVSQRSVDVRR